MQQASPVAPIISPWTPFSKSSLHTDFVYIYSIDLWVIELSYTNMYITPEIFSIHIYLKAWLERFRAS